ncbi:thiamine pyrophosphate enzyme TPP binding domain protein [Metallosphaera sedula]|uniref:2-oxoacid oxidoreductase (ferredoxin) n=3 Tax=Metallosphaera TaxID=41980 RepID=A4YDV7_METS5|nr:MULTISPECIES: thiamine pyrophosphate-requiring protein [Metallosphaera]ABP94609.1 thiamine pyrophosphate enzyme TPP binding domain protein [Metallosphaera sedula DSM 5348]AIM26596.1 thiamine pyrophosphate enzyme TPP binding domain protein [Metallosphaera sedula]AKV73577.1 acetolactate synthase catalytic subunit [Metallosphaera sedula]AKV75818.1 acetolactate synthase catalytic subunit [Metallosphaera sedula]AKV78067.1 acetolactate synthase catalytic subunit [Metallosphaera sedula]
MEQTTAKSSAGLILALLKEEGIDKIFMVSGTDYASFIEEKVRDPNLPDFIVVPHEITASAMALGYSLGGKMGVVAVHTVPGTLNALGIVSNAFTSRIPLLVLAGRSPYTEEGSTASRNLRIHWTQEARDQGEFGRQYLKWDFEIRDPGQTSVAVRRALQIAQSEPKGPVYLTLPREVSVSQAKPVKVNMSPYEPGPSREAIAKADKLIEESERPAIITWRGGRRREWYDSLREFADRLGAPVLNYVGEVVNYPSAGDMALDKLNLDEPDLIIIVESEVPWIPKRVKVKAPVIKIDVEPAYTYIPYYGFPCDVCIQSTPHALKEIHIRGKDKWGEEIRERVKRQREAKRREISSLENSSRVHPRLLSSYVSSFRAVVVNEYPFNPRYGNFEFGDYYGDLSEGYLGWALGAGLGIKMATDRDVIITTGDGSFIFGVPEAFYYVASTYGLPAMVVIYDNSGWLASAEAVEEVFPEGLAKAKRMFPGADFKRYNIGETVRAFGGYFKLAETPEEAKIALTEGWNYMKKGGLSVVQVVVERTR